MLFYVCLIFVTDQAFLSLLLLFFCEYIAYIVFIIMYSSLSLTGVYCAASLWADILLSMGMQGQ